MDRSTEVTFIIYIITLLWRSVEPSFHHFRAHSPFATAHHPFHIVTVNGPFGFGFGFISLGSIRLSPAVLGQSVNENLQLIPLRFPTTMGLIPFVHPSQDTTDLPLMGGADKVGLA